MTRGPSTPDVNRAVRERVPAAWPALQHRWYSLDLELRALPLAEAARAAHERGEAPSSLLTSLEALVHEDDRLRARDALDAVGAARVEVRRVGVLTSLIVYGQVRVYEIGAPWGEGVFTKHTLERYAAPVPTEALARLADVQRRGVEADEVAVFAEVGPDPYLAVRCGDDWYVLHRWGVTPLLRAHWRAL